MVFVIFFLLLFAAVVITASTVPILCRGLYCSRNVANCRRSARLGFIVPLLPHDLSFTGWNEHVWSRLLVFVGGERDRNTRTAAIHYTLATTRPTCTNFSLDPPSFAVVGRTSCQSLASVSLERLLRLNDQWPPISPCSFQRRWDGSGPKVTIVVAWCNYAKYWYACYTTYTYVFTQALIASPLLCPLVIINTIFLDD